MGEVLMKKTFVTVMPNHIGAFLKASRCFAEFGVNITSVVGNRETEMERGGERHRGRSCLVRTSGQLGPKLNRGKRKAPEWHKARRAQK